MTRPGVAAVVDLRALPAMEVASRLDRLRAALGEAEPAGGAGAMLVTGLVDIRWLTGFTGSAALLLVLPDGCVFVTDGRYRDQAEEQLGASGVAARIEVHATQAAQRDVLARAAAGHGAVALQADRVTWAQQQAMAADWFPQARLVPTTGVVDRLRRVKDGGEVARIEAAAAIADAALAAVRGRLTEGPTERDFAMELDMAMRRLGAGGPSFETIVASGPNGAKPHHRPGDRRLVEGDLVVLDFGALVDGYCSDMTRTFSLGEPGPLQRRMLDTVVAAQAAGVGAVSAGVHTRTVDATCRSVIAASGFGADFTHGTGHGLGLEIHEDPRLSQAADWALEPGNVVTVEPGVYRFGLGGVRVEDTVLVCADGCRRLTHTPKDPVLR